MSVQTSTASCRVAHRVALLPGLMVLVALASLTPAPGQAARAVPQDAATGAAHAAPGPGYRSFADRALTMDEAVDLAQRRYSARVVRAEVSDRGGRRVYLLRLLSKDGRVFNVTVDAATGSIS